MLLYDPLVANLDKHLIKNFEKTLQVFLFEMLIFCIVLLVDQAVDGVFYQKPYGRKGVFGDFYKKPT